MLVAATRNVGTVELAHGLDAGREKLQRSLRAGARREPRPPRRRGLLQPRVQLARHPRLRDGDDESSGRPRVLPRAGPARLGAVPGRLGGAHRPRPRPLGGGGGVRRRRRSRPRAARSRTAGSARCSSSASCTPAAATATRGRSSTRRWRSPSRRTSWTRSVPWRSRGRRRAGWPARPNGSRTRPPTRSRAPSAASIAGWSASSRSGATARASPTPAPRRLPEPYRAELTGDHAAAARFWTARGCRYDAALALTTSDAEDELRDEPAGAAGPRRTPRRGDRRAAPARAGRPRRPARAARGDAGEPGRADRAPAGGPRAARRRRPQRRHRRDAVRLGEDRRPPRVGDPAASSGCARAARPRPRPSASASSKDREASRSRGSARGRSVARMTAIQDDAELKTRHRAMWATGDYPKMVDTFLLPLGPRLVEACAIKPGDRVLDVAAGTGNASIPAARRGAQVVASDLTPELLEAGRAAAGEARHRVGDRRRRAAAVRVRVLRRRDVLDRRDVRPAPPGGRRRARPRLPPGRHDRAAELDARGHARRAVPHHEALRRGAAARRPVTAPVGRRGAPRGAVRRSRDVRHAAPRRRSRSPRSGTRTTTASTSRPTTAPPSPPAPTPRATAAPMSSTPRSTRSATSGTAAAGLRRASRRSICSPSRRATLDHAPGVRKDRRP